MECKLCHNLHIFPAVVVVIARHYKVAIALGTELLAIIPGAKLFACITAGALLSESRGNKNIVVALQDDTLTSQHVATIAGLNCHVVWIEDPVITKSSRLIDALLDPRRVHIVRGLSSKTLRDSACNLFLVTLKQIQAEKAEPVIHHLYDYPPQQV